MCTSMPALPARQTSGSMPVTPATRLAPPSHTTAHTPHMHEHQCTSTPALLTLSIKLCHQLTATCAHLPAFAEMWAELQEKMHAILGKQIDDRSKAVAEQAKPKRTAPVVAPLRGARMAIPGSGSKQDIVIRPAGASKPSDGQGEAAKAGADSTGKRGMTIAAPAAFMPGQNKGPLSRAAAARSASPARSAGRSRSPGGPGGARIRGPADLAGRSFRRRPGAASPSPAGRPGSRPGSRSPGGRGRSPPRGRSFSRSPRGRSYSRSYSRSPGRSYSPRRGSPMWRGRGRGRGFYDGGRGRGRGRGRWSRSPTGRWGAGLHRW